MQANTPALLRALASAATLNNTNELTADQVNALSEALGLPLEHVPDRIEALQQGGLVALRWGGTVCLTAKGQALAEGRTESGGAGGIQVGDIGPNANVVIGSPSGVAGARAMGAGAQRIEQADRRDLALADLVALLQTVRQLNPQLESQAQSAAQELEAALEGTLEQAQCLQPDKAALEQHLERATSVMTRLGKLSEATLKLSPAVKRIAELFATLSV